MIRHTLLTAVGITLLSSACDNKPKSTEVKEVKTEEPTTPAVVTTPVKKETGKLIGVWYDEEIKSEKGEQIAYVVISKEKQIFIQAVAFPGTKLVVSDVPEIDPGATELRKTTEGYANINSPTEEYKVDKKGNLLIYDNNELVMTCKKVM